MHVARHPGVGERKEAREAEIGDHDRNPEQQGDRAEVHRTACLLERQDAGADHETRPDQGNSARSMRRPGIVPIASAR